MELLAEKGRKALQVLLDGMEDLVHQGQRDQRGMPVRQVPRDKMVHQEVQVHQGQRDQRGQVPRDKMVPQEEQVQPERQVLPESKETKETLANRALEVRDVEN